MRWSCRPLPWRRRLPAALQPISTLTRAMSAGWSAGRRKGAKRAGSPAGPAAIRTGKETRATPTPMTVFKKSSHAEKKNMSTAQPVINVSHGQIPPGRRPSPKMPRPLPFLPATRLMRLRRARPQFLWMMRRTEDPTARRKAAWKRKRAKQNCPRSLKQMAPFLRTKPLFQRTPFPAETGNVPQPPLNLLPKL